MKQVVFNNYPTYLPWSLKELKAIFTEHKSGYIPVLYLELSARCTKAQCLYCDSPFNQDIAGELTWADIQSLVYSLKPRGLRWLYICGRGEPSEDRNLFPLLQLCQDLEIRVSFFTNGLGFQNGDITLLRETGACMLLKLDSFDPKVFNHLLRTTGAAEKIYALLDSLIHKGFLQVDDQSTNLALAIVPTKLNIDTIPQIVKFCQKQGIYPAVGEMELTARAVANKSYLGGKRGRS